MALLEFLTGIAALFTAVLVPVLLLLGKRKADKIERKAVQIEHKADEIHGLVNSRLTAVLERVEQLTAALEAENMPVPEPRADKHLR